jgi:hypothetical protein
MTATEITQQAIDARANTMLSGRYPDTTGYSRDGGIKHLRFLIHAATVQGNNSAYFMTVKGENHLANARRLREYLNEALAEAEAALRAEAATTAKLAVHPGRVRHAMTTTEAPTVPLARRIRAVLDTGVHPATRLPILPDPDATCGACAHLTERPLADGTTRTRCQLAVSRRGGPDLLPRTPACDQHTPRA